MLRFEPTVRIGYFGRELADILTHASVWSLRTRIDVVVNSANDLTHGDVTLHTFDLALDLDTAGDQPADLAPLAMYLKRWLSSTYDVVLERDHVHVEWDADARRRAREIT